MAERRNLIWPFAGRADTDAYAEQAPLTTKAARSVRNRCPSTGRIRGAMRSTLARWNPDVIGSGSSRIKALASTAFDTRKTEFSFTEGDEELVWSEPTPSKTDTLEGRTDGQGNVYAVDGPAGIVKFNSAGAVIMKIALPVADPAHIVRALWVDTTDRIFAAVSAGGDVETARMFCILQLPENQYHVLWMHTPGAYTEALRVYRGSQLYAAHNYPAENRGRVVIYDGIGLVPREASRIEDVAYPINDMDVGDDGAMYHAAPGAATGPSDMRPGHPGSPELFHPPIRAWALFDLENARKRWWSIYDAEAIDITDVDQEQRTEPALEEGQQVLRWRDISGNDRHFYAGSIYHATESGPRYVRVGGGGLPAVRFTNTPAVTGPPAQAAVLQSMATLGNASIDPTLASQQRTAIPAYTGAMWAWFILFRPTRDADVTIPSPRIVWSMENQATAPASDHVLWFNRDCGAALPGAFNSGFVSYYATTDTVDDGDCATADQALGVDADTVTDNGMVLVTVLWDGQIEPADTTKTRCLFRVNGRPVDRFEGLPFASLLPTWLGFAPVSITSDGDDPERRLNGDISFMATLVMQSSTVEPKVATHDQLESTDAPQNQTDNEIARIEAMILYAKGCGRLLPPSTATFPHFYGLADNGSSLFLGGPPKPGTGGLSDPHAQILHQEPLVAKHDAQGKLQWVVNMHTHPDGNDEDSGGYGYGVRARTIASDEKTHVWMTGPPSLFPTNPSEVALRKVIDLGTSFSGAQADGAWRHRFPGNEFLDYQYPRMAADKFGNLFFPGNASGGGSLRSLHVFAKDPDVSGDAVQRTEFLLAGDAAFAHAVALPPDSAVPEYRGDIAEPISPDVYVFTEQADASAFESVHRIKLVLVNATTTGNPEEVITLAVADDDVWGVTPTTAAIVSGGSGVIDGASQYVQAFRAGEDIVILDGTKVFAYKLRDGVLEELKSTSSGEIPGPARLGMYWRYRLVLALEGGKYAASRLGNIRDWNLRPGSTLSGTARQTSTQAFTGSLTRAGEAQDSIVAMIPVWDDLAYLVGKTRILRMTGDPQDGGQIHVVGNSTAGVFGDSWCIDDQSRVFLWGRDPRGLYMVPPDANLIPLTGETLEESDFADIDMATHRMVLAWDPEEGVVRVFQVKWADPSTVVAHWVWEERTHRLVKVPPIWQDRYADETLQPTAVAHLGGESESGLIVGCADGRIRYYDPDGRDDDGTAVDSFVLFELTSGLPEKRAARVSELSIVLADDLEGCMAELFVAETAERLGPIVASKELKAGRNVWRVKVKGPHIWLRLRNAATGRWAFEEGSYVIEDAGKVRAVRT